MTQWGLDTLFNPAKRHMDEEKRRLQATRQQVGDTSGGKRIDLESGKVRIGKAAVKDDESDESDESDDSIDTDDGEGDDSQRDDSDGHAHSLDADAGEQPRERGPARPVAAAAHGARLLTRKVHTPRAADEASDPSGEHWGRREPRQAPGGRADRSAAGNDRSSGGERAGFDRGAGSDRPRFDRGGSAGGDRPAFAARPDRPGFAERKPAGDRPRFDGPAAARGGSARLDSGSARSDRPRFADRQDRPSFGDRKAGADRPRFDRPAGGERPKFGADRPPAGERARGGFNVERATLPAGARESRSSSAPRGDRPRFGGESSSVRGGGARFDAGANRGDRRERGGAAGGFIKPQGGKFQHDTRGGKAAPSKGGFTNVHSRSDEPRASTSGAKPAFGKAGGGKFGGSKFGGGKFGGQGGGKFGGQAGSKFGGQAGSKFGGQGGDKRGKGFGARQAFGDKAARTDVPAKSSRRDDIDDE
jgi:hypothetical protein